MSVNAYEALEIIGTGSFGVIRKVKRVSDGQIFVRKEIDYRRMSEKEKKQLVAEVNILRELNHPNIVKYADRVLDRENCMIYLIMEFCENGDLSGVIRRCKKEGDIKAENVFLDKEQNVKLGDFGLSKNLDNPEETFASTYVGTPYYMSPELVDECNYNAKSDIWALGCLIYELCALEPPFQAKTQMALSAKIKQGKVASIPEIYSKELDYIVKSMLTTRYTRRPGTVELLAHETIKKRQQKYNSTSRYLEIQQRLVSESLPTKSALSISQREANINHKERELDALEMKLKSKEEELNRREKILAHKERLLVEKLCNSEVLKSVTTHSAPNTDRKLAINAGFARNDQFTHPNTASRITPRIPLVNRGNSIARSHEAKNFSPMVLSDTPLKSETPFTERFRKNLNISSGSTKKLLFPDRENWRD